MGYKKENIKNVFYATLVKTRYLPRTFLYELVCIIPQAVVGGLCWNSSGALLGAHYRAAGHEGWCSHAAVLAVWHVGR